jgi:hypothetical protein
LTAIGLLVLKIFQWDVNDLPIGSLAPAATAAWMLGVAVYISAFLPSVYMTLKSFSHHRLKNVLAPPLLALLINLSMLPILLLPQAGDIALRLYFIRDYQARNTVVTMLEQNLLQTELHDKAGLRDSSQFAAVPAALGSLSKGGNRVVVGRAGDRMTVLFFTDPPFLDKYTGFIYTSDDTWPAESFYYGYKRAIRLDGNWFWVGN